MHIAWANDRFNRVKPVSHGRRNSLTWDQASMDRLDACGIPAMNDDNVLGEMLIGGENLRGFTFIQSTDTKQ